MKIATYNVNGINGRLDVLLRWLEGVQPEVVCLQELKAPQDRFPQSAIEAAGYQAIWVGQPRWNGVALLSRLGTPVGTRRSLPGGSDDNQSRYIEAAIDGIIYAGFYAPNGNPRPGPKFEYKLDWLDRLVAHARELLASGAPVVLLGDFNVIPTERDVHSPERWLDDALFAPEARAKFSALLDQGWVDGVRSVYPDETVYTFWHYYRMAFARNAGIRIDHILLSPDLSERLVGAGVDRTVREWEKTSDHAPVWIDVTKA